MKKLNCLRCSSEMNYISTEKFQLGQAGWVLGDLPNLVAGSMEFDIYVCSNCGKVEFFQSNNSSSDGIAQTKCPKCGKSHDIDCPKCPFCKYDYIN